MTVVDSWPSIWGGVDGGGFRVSVKEASLFGETAIERFSFSASGFSSAQFILVSLFIFKTRIRIRQMDC